MSDGGQRNVYRYQGRMLHVRDLMDYGLLAEGEELEFHINKEGSTHTARLDSDGFFNLADGTVHKSPSGAAKHLNTINTPGWEVWCAPGRDDQRLMDLRTAFYALPEVEGHRIGPDPQFDGRDIWVVRGGKSGVYEEICFEHEVSVIGWDQLPEPPELVTEDWVAQAVAATYLDKSSSSHRNTTSSIWQFMGQIKVGDIIVMPLFNSSDVAIGVCTVPFFFEDDGIGLARFRVGVDWRVRDFDRNLLSAEQLKFLNVPKTVWWLDAKLAKTFGRAVNQKIWWVNQGSSYEFASVEGHIWAPNENKSGVTLEQHARVKAVRPQDLLFHYHKKAIRSIGIVTQAAVPKERPNQSKSEAAQAKQDPSRNDGYSAQVKYHQLSKPIGINELKNRLPESGPFTISGDIQQSYMPPLSRGYANYIRREFNDRIPEDIKKLWPIKGEEPHTSLTLSELAHRLLVEPKDTLDEIVDLLDDRPQTIFYGPPGTGKTYIAMELAAVIAGSPDRVTLVQFHPSYSYEDFVEGWRPTEDGAFRLTHGPLRRLAAKAQATPGQKFVLVIDEINRANLSKVLGELFFLLEYRDRSVTLQYSDTDFVLPENLFIIGTMNTADRSIALVDAALRRRFHFHGFFPDQPPIKGLLGRWLAVHHPEVGWLAEVVDTANELLGERDLAIGPSHFMKTNLTEPLIERIWIRSVIPYLEDYFFDDPGRVQEFALSRLRTSHKNIDAENDDVTAT